MNTVIRSSFNALFIVVLLSLSVTAQAQTNHNYKGEVTVQLHSGESRQAISVTLLPARAILNPHSNDSTSIAVDLIDHVVVARGEETEFYFVPARVERLYWFDLVVREQDEWLLRGEQTEAITLYTLEELRLVGGSTMVPGETITQDNTYELTHYYYRKGDGELQRATHRNVRHDIADDPAALALWRQSRRRKAAGLTIKGLSVGGLAVLALTYQGNVLAFAGGFVAAVGVHFAGMKVQESADPLLVEALLTYQAPN